MPYPAVYNSRESAVFEAVEAAAPRFPALQARPTLLADVACVALNRLPAQYVCHSTDLAFSITEREQQADRRHLAESVDFAFGYVQARLGMAARRG